VLRLGALGDVIFVLPAISLLHRHWPQAEIHWLVKSPYRSLLEGHPAIARIWTFQGGVRQILRTGLTLRKENFDLVLDYHANLRSGLISWLSGAPDRVGFARPFNKEGNSLFNHHRVSPPSLRSHKIDRNLFLTRSFLNLSQDQDCKPQLPASQSALESFDKLREGHPSSLVIVHPGTSRKGEIKRWFEDRYAAVINKVLETCDSSVVLLWGSSSEHLLVKKIKTLAGAAERVWIPDHRFSFPEILALYERAACYLGVDSGPMHLANAVGLPVIALYGPKSLEIYRPYFEGAVVLSKNDEVGCAPCNATRCHNPEGRVCLTALKVEEVALAVINVVKSRRSGRL
jgi:heptosyltransferase I